MLDPVGESQFVKIRDNIVGRLCAQQLYWVRNFPRKTARYQEFEQYLDKDDLNNDAVVRCLRLK